MKNEIIKMLTSRLWYLYVHSDGVELSDYGGFIPDISDIDRMIAHLKRMKKTGQQAINEHNAKQAKIWKVELPSPPEYTHYKKKGFIYFIEKDGYIKIGRTSQNVEERMNSLSNNHPNEVPIKLIHSIPTEDVLEAEKAFHHYFASKRIKGEWFQLTKKDIDCVKEIEKV